MTTPALAFVARRQSPSRCGRECTRTCRGRSAPSREVSSLSFRAERFQRFGLGAADGPLIWRGSGRGTATLTNKLHV